MTSAATNLARSYLAKLEQEVPNFLTQIVKSLKEQHRLDVSKHEADHVCWRTESMAEYQDLVDALKKDPECWTLLTESEIGGRPIATFALAQHPISSVETLHQVRVIEIPSPKEGSPYKSGLEHVEFVIGDGICEDPWNDKKNPNNIHQLTFEEFIARYPDLPWSRKAQNKAINPDISLKIDLPNYGRCSVKFHLMPLQEVIAVERKASESVKM